MAIQVYVLTDPQDKILGIFGDILSAFRSLSATYGSHGLSFQVERNKVYVLLPQGPKFVVTTHRILENHINLSEEAKLPDKPF